MSPDPDVNPDAVLAADLAAGRPARLLLELAGGRRDGRRDGSRQSEMAADLGRRGDQASNAFLLGQLAAERPGDAVLSEESEDDLARLEARRVWIIDPLDGTREFAMPGRQDWAVHVALWETGAPASPPRRWRCRRPASVLRQRPARPAARSGRRPGARPLMLVSDSRPPAFAAAVADRVGADVAPMGSAGAKTMAVVRGDADAYVHAGGQWEWDSAAPVGVALAAGLHASRLDGTPAALYNQPHPYLPDLLVCRPELAARLLEALAGFGSAATSA